MSDLGMTGPVESVLGVKPEIAIQKMKGKLPVRFENAQGEQMMNCALFCIDDKTGAVFRQSALISGERHGWKI